MDITTKSRRQFLRYLAASPVAGAMAGMEFANGASAVMSPADAIDVFDLKETARGTFPPRTGVTWPRASMTIRRCGQTEQRLKNIMHGRNDW